MPGHTEVEYHQCADLTNTVDDMLYETSGPRDETWQQLCHWVPWQEFKCTSRCAMNNEVV
jgi:hypothetical protein